MQAFYILSVLLSSILTILHPLCLQYFMDVFCHFTQHCSCQPRMRPPLGGLQWVVSLAHFCRWAGPLSAQEGWEIRAGRITRRFFHTSMSAEGTVLGLECGAHIFPRRSSREIAPRPPTWIVDLGRAIRFDACGIRAAAAEGSKSGERQSSGAGSEPGLSKSDRESQCAHHHGSLWRLSVPGLPRFF